MLTTSRCDEMACSRDGRRFVVMEDELVRGGKHRQRRVWSSQAETSRGKCLVWLEANQFGYKLRGGGELGD